MAQSPAFLLEDEQGEQFAFPGAKPAFVCFVKEDCPTCNDVMPLIETTYRALGNKVDFFVCGQTREGNRTLVERHGLTVPVLDDSSLKVSFAWDVEIVPTLCVADAGGDSLHSLTGFVRDEWRRAVDDLAGAVGTAAPGIDWPAFPEWRAGCGSLSVDPAIAARLQAESENSPLRARRIDIAPRDDEFEFMFDQGFSDGMPLIPPTPERVMRMLGGTTRDPQEVIATVPPNMGDATVEKVAINAVMAGCRPEYLPVVLTGLEAVCTDEFNIHGVMATTMGASPRNGGKRPHPPPARHEHEARRPRPGQPGERHHRPGVAPGGPQYRRCETRRDGALDAGQPDEVQHVFRGMGGAQPLVAAACRTRVRAGRFGADGVCHE